MHAKLFFVVPSPISSKMRSTCSNLSYLNSPSDDNSNGLYCLKIDLDETIEFNNSWDYPTLIFWLTTVPLPKSSKPKSYINARPWSLDRKSLSDAANKSNSSLSDVSLINIEVRQ